jgi:hypothetical protein
MRMLAALMVSMMLLTTTLLLRAVATNKPSGTPAGSVSDGAPLDHSQRFVVIRDR